MRLVSRKRDFEGMDLTEEIGIELAVGALGSKYMIDGDVQRVIDGNDSLWRHGWLQQVRLVGRDCLCEF